MAIPGNLPQDVTQAQSTTTFFNDYFAQQPSTGSNVNDAVKAYFQSLTGDVDTGNTLAGAILYTALQQNLDPISIIEHLKTLSDKVDITAPTLIPVSDEFITADYTSYQDILENKEAYPVGMIFYVADLDIFYKKIEPILMPVINQDLEYESIVDVVSTDGYKAQVVDQYDGPATYNFYKIGYTNAKYSVRTTAGAIDTNTTDDNGLIWYNNGKQYANPGPSVAYNSLSEVDAYITMFLNLNRSGTSLLGLSNSPQTSKYVSRTILA